MKRIVLVLTILFSAISFSQQSEEKKINDLLNSWHKAAATTNFDAYFGYFASGGIFIGTDATEIWDVPAFKKFAKPFFDKGKAWSFTSLKRNVYFGKSNDIAWFDELLDTQMKLCRGSGVLVKENGNWKLKHYVLSMTIPNPNVDAVVAIKASLEDDLSKELSTKK